MEHLFNSVVRVEAMSLTQTDGVASTDWHVVEGMEALPCRLDLNFVRPGKDILPAPVAGKAPDRIGVMFTYSHAPLKPGHRLTAIPHPDTGAFPVQGTFEIRVVPDQAIAFAVAHHIEVQIIEVAQEPKNFSWPGQAPA